MSTNLLPMGEVFGVPARPYNRFQGNPPQGMTPEDAFQSEMGFPYDPTSGTGAEIQALQAQIDNLTVQVNYIKSTVGTKSGN